MKRNTQAIVLLAAEKSRLARLRVVAAIAASQAQGARRSTSARSVLPLAYQRRFFMILSIRIWQSRFARYGKRTHTPH